MAAWTYLVADLRTNIILGELPLAGVRMSKVLNGTGTFAGETIPLGDVRMSTVDVYDWLLPARRAVYALRDNRPWWGGVIWAAEYVSDAEAVRISAADWWSYFDHRKVLPVLTVPVPDYTHVATRTVTYTATDQNEIARQLVALAQSHTGGDIGIQLDTSSSGILRDRTYLGYELRDVGEALRQLSTVVDGPDIVFDVGPLDGQGRPTRLLRLGAPHLGQQGSPHVWEHAGNLTSYRWPIDGARMATRTYAVGDGIDQGALIAVAEDVAKYADGWPLLELERGYTTVVKTGTLQSHADADQAAARLPVALPQLTVRADLPPTLGDYGVGDDARLVIRDPFFPAGVDVAVRLVGIDVTAGDTTETVTLTCSPILEEGA